MFVLAGFCLFSANPSDPVCGVLQTWWLLFFLLLSCVCSSNRPPSPCSTSAHWRTALSVCLCCWPQLSKFRNTWRSLQLSVPVKRSSFQSSLKMWFILAIIIIKKNRCTVWLVMSMFISMHIHPAANSNSSNSTFRASMYCFSLSHVHLFFFVVSLMWWCQHTPRTAGPVCSSSFTSP